MAIAQARETVAQNSNDLAQLMVNLDDTRIVAPASGIVLKKYKQPTEIVPKRYDGVSDQQSIVATLGDQLMVRVGINEVDIPKVALRAVAKIHIDAMPDAVFSGYVQEIAPASTNAFPDSGTAASGSGGSIAKFSVKVPFSHYDVRLRPGMSAGVDIISARHAHVVLAPLEAISFTGNKGIVTVLTAAKKQEKRTVTLGLRDDTSVEVITGLHASEQLVVPPINGKERRTIDITGSDNG